MLARKKLVPLTKLLRNNHLTYSWGFPTKLLVTKDGTLEEGLQLTKKWGLLPNEEETSFPTKTPGHISPEWRQIDAT